MDFQHIGCHYIMTIFMMLYVFDFNKPFDINKTKMKYIYYNDNNEQTVNKHYLLKPNTFYNKEFIERLKHQIEEIFAF